MRKIVTAILFVLLLASGRSAAQLKYSIPYPKMIPDGRDTLELFVIGDVMMHSAQFGYDHRKFLSGIADMMNKADFCIANMEMTLAGKPYSGYPAFSSPEYIADYIAGECGADVLLTANNHIMDRGKAGLERTLALYSSLRDSLGTEFTGCSRSEEERERTFPLMIEGKDVRIAIINFTYGTNNPRQDGWPKVEYMDRESLLEAFGKAKSEKADFILVLPHWGEEYKLKHSSRQEEWAEWLVSQGADAIVGSHPHVVQDSCHIGKVPVIYSMGNAVSNMSATNTRLELAVTLRFEYDRFSGRKKMLEPELHFLWCCLPGRLTDSYTTIPVKKWASRKGDWLIKSDYDNMVETLDRVRKATGIAD